MRCVTVLLILCAAAWAGCFDDAGAGAGPPLDSSEFRSEVQTERSGTVVVDVLDAEARAVPAAAVTLADWTRETDREGQAVFQDVEPGRHNVTVAKDGFRPARAFVDVPPGDTISAVVRLLAGRAPETPGAEAGGDVLGGYTETFHVRGRFECSATYLIITGDCMALADFLLVNATGSCGPPCPGDATAETYVLEFPLDAGWKSVVVEMAWEADATAGETMTLNLEPSEGPEDGHSARYARVFGESPIGFTIHAGEAHPTATSSADGQQPDLPNPNGGEAVQARAFVAGHAHNAGGTDLLGVGAAVNQEFEVFATVFYVEPAPDGWSIADG